MQIQITKPELKKGEIYAGSIINPDGNGRHVVLLPGDNDDANHEDQTKWAESIGGVLPNRVELLILFEKFKDQFKKTWYWSDTTVEGYQSSAWCQSFDDGTQSDGHKRYELRGRAVRRVLF